MATRRLPTVRVFFLQWTTHRPELRGRSPRGSLSAEALENAVWQLARFAALSGNMRMRPPAKRCLAGTRDPAKQAAGSV
jgi:hypothetical protein